MSMIERTLVRFKTKDLFNKRLGLKEIPETSICFIEDTKEIWTHGQFYAIPNEEVFVSNGEEPTGNEEIWIDLSEDSPTVPTIEEAPKDGKQYARKDGSWDEVISNGDYFIIEEVFINSDGYSVEAVFHKNNKLSSYEELKLYLDNNIYGTFDVYIKPYGGDVNLVKVISVRKNNNKSDLLGSEYIYEFIFCKYNKLVVMSLTFDESYALGNYITYYDLSGYLSKDNYEEYSPTSDYNPATKKYVDENIKSSNNLYYCGQSKVLDIRNINYPNNYGNDGDYDDILVEFLNTDNTSESNKKKLRYMKDLNGVDMYLIYGDSTDTGGV